MQSTTLTPNQRQEVIRHVKYLLEQQGHLLVNGQYCPIRLVTSDDDKLLTFDIVTYAGNQGTTKPLLSLDISLSRAKGYNFNLIITIHDIDMPISFIYGVEKAFISLNTHLQLRDLTIKPSVRELKPI